MLARISSADNYKNAGDKGAMSRRYLMKLCRMPVREFNECIDYLTQSGQIKEVNSNGKSSYKLTKRGNK